MFWKNWIWVLIRDLGAGDENATTHDDTNECQLTTAGRESPSLNFGGLWHKKIPAEQLTLWRGEFPSKSFWKI